MESPINHAINHRVCLVCRRGIPARGYPHRSARIAMRCLKPLNTIVRVVRASRGLSFQARIAIDSQMSINRLKVAFLGPPASFSHQVRESFPITPHYWPEFSCPLTIAFYLTGRGRVLREDGRGITSPRLLCRCLHCCAAPSRRLRGHPIRELDQWLCRADIGSPCGSERPIHRRRGLRGILFDRAPLSARA
jgi:hypothetical protein